MPETKFAKLLCRSSSALLQCGLKVEDHLRRVLDRAEACDAEVAIITAHTLTKLTLDIGSAPLYFAEKLKASGREMRTIIEVLDGVLQKARPDRVTSHEELQEALRKTSKICAEQEGGDKMQPMFALLVKEIAQVYMELRAILKRQRTAHSKRLFHEVQKYLPRITPSLLCYTYNSLKLEMCVKCINKCGPKSNVDRDTMRRVLKNIIKLMQQARTLTVLHSKHHEILEKATEMVKDSDIF